MIKKEVSIILFYDDKENVLLQDRKKMSKHREEYGFFGGHTEKGETQEQTLKREIKEELGIDINDFKFFKTYNQIIKELDIDLTRNVYLASIPNLNKIKVEEGDLALMRFEDSLNLKMIPGDTELLKEIYKEINK